MATKSPEPAPEGPDQCPQRRGKDPDNASASATGPGGPKLSRRQIIDEGLDNVLMHDAELLLRLADA